MTEVPLLTLKIDASIMARKVGNPDDEGYLYLELIFVDAEGNVDRERLSGKEQQLICDYVIAGREEDVAYSGD